MAITSIATSGDFVALTGALRDVYSAEINFAAQGVLRYEECCVYKTELSATRGQTVVFTRYGDLTPSFDPISESATITPRTAGNSTVSISVNEYAGAAAVTEKITQLGWDDIYRTKAKQLGRDYALTRDIVIKRAIEAGGQTFFANENAAGIGDLVAADTFDVEGIRRVVEFFRTNNVPMFLNNYYLCYLHPHQAADLMRDPDWINAGNYHANRAQFNGELGRWQNVIFIETPYASNGVVADSHPAYDEDLHEAGDDDSNLYRAIFVGDQGVGLADALPVEIRDDGVHDFGRQHRLAWYAIFGAGILDNNHVVHMVTA